MLDLEVINICHNVVTDLTGIRLTWYEIMDLSRYVKSFESMKRERGVKFNLPPEAVRQFMLDNFGIDAYTICNRTVQTIRYGKRTVETMGLGLAKTEEFKEYCRRNVDFWRSERELI